MIIYIDTCCYGRQYDDQTQATIVKETAAIAAIIEMCKTNDYCIVGSLAVTSEIADNSNDIKRKTIEEVFENTINKYFAITANEVARGHELEKEGLGKMDSLHLAAAETAGADVLLTTDVDFIKISIKKNLSVVKVINPLNF